MKICIYGLGAIGTLLAARLSQAGHEVSGVARGKTLKAISERGVGLEDKTGTHYYQINVSEKPEDLGEQDLVIIAIKQPALLSVAEQIGPLLGSHTKVLTAMNGIPWWFLMNLSAPWEENQLMALDPTGVFPDYITTEQVIGCVIHISCFSPEVGLCHLNAGNKLIIGQPDRELTPELQAIAEALQDAKFDVEVSDHIHQEIWFKLWGNMTHNPVSALTRATSDKILDDPLVSAYCCRVMEEAAIIGEAIGCKIDQTPEERNRATRELGAMKTSMLQDVEKGNPLEYEAIVGAAYEIATKLNIETPFLGALYGLIRLYDQQTHSHT